jgi:S-adenosylmethionine decarboxylase
MPGYNPGLHIISSFSAGVAQLNDARGCKQIFDELIGELTLQKVGEVYHSFEGGGFTAVVCLTESHVSIHTWPEFNLATFDVFLSDFRNNNSEKVREFFSRSIEYFNATVISKQEISR